jgi:CheY-like chemotaxis protein
VVERDAAKQAAPTFGGLPFDYIQANMGQLLADCELAANRIARIVRDLKDFSRRSDPDDFRPVAVNLAVENALRLARATIGKRGTRLSVRLDPQPPPVNGHLPSLEQVLLNLIINGIQAIDHDRGLLEIETTTDPEDGWVVVRVADNGRGVDESASDRLFDPFFTDRQSEGGTGLGLSVTYNIVQTHGGEIGFEPRPDGGTVFTVRLPLAAGPPRRRVLVADDDEVIRNMMAQALAGVGGFLVEQAANGEEALIKLGIFRPHLLVLDLIMPVLDGLEVCRTIRGQPELGTTRILLVTGHPDSPDLAELRKFDGVAVLPKPFEVLDFLDTARRMLGLSDEGPVSA